MTIDYITAKTVFSIMSYLESVRHYFPDKKNVQEMTENFALDIEKLFQYEKHSFKLSDYIVILLY